MGVLGLGGTPPSLTRLGVTASTLLSRIAFLPGH